jgi:hypothetical protein
MLLVFDRISVIRPTDVEASYDARNQAVFERIPHTFEEIKRHQYEMQLSCDNESVIERAFQLIASTRPKPKNQLSVIVRPEGTELPGYVWMHVSKLNDSIRQLLEKYELIGGRWEAMFQEQAPRGFKLVNERACNLILSLIADHYANERRLTSITDRPLDHFINRFNRPDIEYTGEACLASSILQVEIPDDLLDLSPDEYVELRNRYADLRIPFQAAVRSLWHEHRLGLCTSTDQFKETVHTATREFCMETGRLRASHFGSLVKKWTPISLGILMSAAGHFTGNTAIANVAEGVTASLLVYQGLAPAPVQTESDVARQILGDLCRELNHSVLYRRLTLP